MRFPPGLRESDPPGELACCCAARLLKRLTSRPTRDELELERLIPGASASTTDPLFSFRSFSTRAGAVSSSPAGSVLLKSPSSFLTSTSSASRAAIRLGWALERRSGREEADGLGLVSRLARMLDVGFVVDGDGRGWERGRGGAGVMGVGMRGCHSVRGAQEWRHALAHRRARWRGVVRGSRERSAFQHAGRFLSQI